METTAQKIRQYRLSTHPLLRKLYALRATADKLLTCYQETKEVDSNGCRPFERQWIIAENNYSELAGEAIEKGLISFGVAVKL